MALRLEAQVFAFINLPMCLSVGVRASLGVCLRVVVCSLCVPWFLTVYACVRVYKCLSCLGLLQRSLFNLPASHDSPLSLALMYGPHTCSVQGSGECGVSGFEASLCLGDVCLLLPVHCLEARCEWTRLAGHF